MSEPAALLLRRQASDGSVWCSRDAVHPHDEVLRLLREPGTFRDDVARELPVLLASDDLRQRTLAVALLAELAGELDRDALASWAAAHEGSVRGVRPAWRIGHDDLEEGVAHELARAARATDPVALAWLRGLALARPWRISVTPHLARLDPEWLLANARALVAHDHLGVLAALDEARQERLIDALSPFPAETPTFFTMAFWRTLSPELAGRLRSRMWPVAPPASSPPTSLRRVVAKETLPRVDYVRREVVAVIAYWGPALSGRLTSLTRLYESIPEAKRSALVATRSEVDARVSFHFVADDLVSLRGFTPRLHVRTNGGAGAHEPRRIAALLEGVSGLVCVVDSVPARRGAWEESRRLLDAALAERALTLEVIPHVWQLTKRDLPGVLPVEELVRTVATDGAPVIASSPTEGWGVREAFAELALTVFAPFAAAPPLQEDST
ncbi:MAG TPA: hypothetical protein PLR99_16050 [Polyangiaceae bacterium]|nr:hypothetical protein [Polyangiaceae bacterium]